MTRAIGGVTIYFPSNAEDTAWYSFVCGHCKSKTSGGVVAYISSEKWLFCTNCHKGSVLTGGIIYPPTLEGPDLEGLPSDIQPVYLEARNCMSVGAYTACELICRKILMHTAVEKGAAEGLYFTDYITHLESSGYVTPPMKEWVNIIREHGNKAAHLIETPDRSRAESTLMFTAELLRLVYEMDYLSKKYKTP